MTIPETCELVIQAGALGAPGEVLVLDTDRPVSILGVAQRPIARSGKKTTIDFTGLGPREEMREVLLSNSEHGVRRSHPKITHVGVPPLSPGDQADLPDAYLTITEGIDLLDSVQPCKLQK